MANADISVAPPSRLWPQPCPLPASASRLPAGGVGDLAEVRQRVVLAEKTDDRAAMAGFGDKRSRDARNFPRDSKAMPLEFADLQFSRLVLCVGSLGEIPQPVAQVNTYLTVRFDPCGNLLIELIEIHYLSLLIETHSPLPFDA